MSQVVVAVTGGGGGGDFGGWGCRDMWPGSVYVCACVRLCM